MQTKRKRFLRKWLPLGTVAVGLGIMGGTYAVWTDTTSVTGSATTGIFDMIVGEEDRAACLVDEAGSVIEIPDQSVSYELTNDKKGIRVSFEGGIPAQLLEGNYIKFEFSMEKKEGSTFEDLKPKEADFQIPDFEVSMEASHISLQISGKDHKFEEQDLYKNPLRFYVFQEIWKETDQLKGSLYMKLTDESQELVTDLIQSYKTVELSAEEAEEAEDFDAGIAVTYQCEIPFYLSQNMGEPDD
ncbi:SipW-dependent-type signal peptide-containing protein [Clostridium sp. HBUAS56010]|uniref:SipW-dependent-type signal peptide-containing protein n=1 Tax=Clostridium sp. HBUAS56010 TaxID=2571127 RepID=UPI00163D9D1C|nr:SipW-dependent-type signal peptide-containing protein [Clostridium sp. HBUAS56010]